MSNILRRYRVEVSITGRMWFNTYAENSVDATIEACREAERIFDSGYSANLVNSSVVGTEVMDSYLIEPKLVE